MQTIFAPSSGKGKAGVAVFRLSGPQALAALQALTRRASLQPRVLTSVKIYNPDTADIIDRCLAVFFPKPTSFTGEDVVELHTHGSVAVSKMLLESVLSI